MRHPFPRLDHEERALAQRAANARAKARGEPMPYPNPWDALDPTKVAAGASPEEIAARYREFRALCPPPAPKRYTI